MHKMVRHDKRKRKKVKEKIGIYNGKFIESGGNHFLIWFVMCTQSSMTVVSAQCLV